MQDIELLVLSHWVVENLNGQGLVLFGVLAQGYNSLWALAEYFLNLDGWLLGLRLQRKVEETLVRLSETAFMGRFPSASRLSILSDLEFWRGSNFVAAGKGALLRESILAFFVRRVHEAVEGLDSDVGLGGVGCLGNAGNDHLNWECVLKWWLNFDCCLKNNNNNWAN